MNTQIPPDSAALRRIAAMLAEAERFRRAGRKADAERVAREAVRAQPGAAPALNFLALLVRDRGDLVEAQALLRRAVAAAPGEALFHENLGNLLQRMGDLAGAEASLRSALALAPQNPEALTRVGFLLKQREANDEALAMLDRALALAPQFFDAHYYRSTTLVALERYDDAIASFAKALSLKPDSPEAHHALGNVLLRAGREEEALAAFKAAIDLAPQFLAAHRAYNALAWEMGRRELTLVSYQQARARVGDTPDLLLAEADQRLRQESAQDAEPLLRRALDAAPARSDIAGVLARALTMQKKYDESIALLEHLVRSDPQALHAHRELANALLEHGRAAEAAAALERALAVAPHDQLLLAFLSLAWRETGDGRLSRLADLDKFVRVYELPPPKGFNGVESFNRTLAADLHALHTRNVAPLDQTLRGGTQTPGFLFDNRSGAIEGVRDQIREAVADYVRALPDDPAHPLVARRSEAFDFSGAWSCRLRSSGFHTNHVHPQGWISSAYYVSLPGAVDEGEQGWLKFGESNLGLGERDRPERTVKPAVGKLVLFPSYFWHGTVPFASQDTRLTIAFDVVPGKAARKSSGY